MRRALCRGLAFALATLFAALAAARPGGGHGFSIPDNLPRGGGGDDGGELLFFVLRLIFFYPRVGVPLVIVIAIVAVVLSRKARLANWDAPHAASVRATPAKLAPRRALDAELARLRELDPDFSQVLFEDFAYRLFASVQRARPDPRALEALAPYLRDDVRAALQREDLSAIEDVVVATLRIESISVPRQQTDDARVRVQLSYEANVTCRAREAASAPRRTLYLRERWTLERAADVRSKPPGSYERLGCPSCGAPLQASDDRRCAYCGQVAGDGRFTFQVAARQVSSEQARPPGVGLYAEERGTDRPTVVASDCETRLAALLAKDPALSRDALLARLRMIYRALNAAYGERELSKVRALLSDGMFDYLRYWIEAYRAQNLRNVLEQMQIERVEWAKVVQDRYFDAITVRLFASGLDYTVDDAGKWVAGDRARPRRYSEYWTLIRGGQTRGPARVDASCPNCAAPLAAAMAGTCVHCSAHLTSGEFDWVLSKIEQDDVYDG